jgi:hypothetical protein
VGKQTFVGKAHTYGFAQQYPFAQQLFILPINSFGRLLSPSLDRSSSGEQVFMAMLNKVGEMLV